MIFKLDFPFKASLKQTNLTAKTDFDNAVSSLDSKIATNKTKNESLENELKKLNNIWFRLFYWQKSFWRRCYTKLFTISATKKIF